MAKSEKPKLTKEERSAIAKEAAKRRWLNKFGADQPAIVAVEVAKSPESGPKHCPACIAGESLEEGEGTHILATVEHPVTLPAAFQDEETSVALPPEKPQKKTAKPMPKELRSASSYAEKRLPKAIKEKADLVVELARKEAEIQELVRVIQALGGHSPVGMPAAPAANGTYRPPQMPQPYPEYAQPAPVVPDVTPPKAMKAGGVAALDLGFLANN
jgi:hypothetical protein